MSGVSVPGSNADLLEVVDRILRLTLNDQVASALLPSDIDGLQHRAQEALQTLSISISDGGDGASHRQVVAATPALCGLAVECVNIVEKAELSTGLARLVATGCEVLAGLLACRISLEVHSDPSSFEWLHNTLEDLSDQLDFLALEVYCGLGRLESATEADDWSAVPEHTFDHFESYWGSIEHRQALQELSAWLLCVVFRALGYADVTASKLMDFANHDVLCLCALLQGLLAARPGGTGLPHDVAVIQGVALRAVCGLTAPELAFPYYAQQQGDKIEDQNRILMLYREVLCAAFVETGLFEAALDTALLHARSDDDGKLVGVHFLAFLAAVLKQAGDVQPTLEDPSPPALRFRAVVHRRADRLGSLLHAVSSVHLPSSFQKELVSSCAELAALISASCENAEDAFTLECRMLLTLWLEHGLAQEFDAPALLVALAAVAANVGDFAISRPRLIELAGCLTPSDRARGRARFARADGPTLARHAADVLLLFDDPYSPPVEAPPPTMPPASLAPRIAAPPAAPGLRDLVQNAPPQLRCALDQKLLCDPVRTPGGIVYERSSIARWLQSHDPVCPMTGHPLRIEDCERVPEIRKQVTEWVRAAGKELRPKKKASQ